MAGHGPPPKDPAKRVRRNADPKPTVTVSQDGETRGPDLPDGLDWHPQTRKWWETWRTSALAQTMTSTDWDFLLDTALLHDQFWSGNASVAAELRLRVAKYGATPEDRQRLRLSVDAPAAGVAGEAKTSGPSRYAHLRVAGQG